MEVDSIEDLEIINDGCMTFVLITLKKRPAECPRCGRETSLINDYRRRVISHSILTERETAIVYRQRRMFCPHCGKAFAEHNPFVAAGRRVSIYTVMHIMNLLRNPSTTFTMAARATGLSVPTVQRIFDEHAGIRLRPFPEILCIDKVYTVKYTQKVYSCVLVDFESCSLYDLLPSRRKADLDSYFLRIPKGTRDSVKYISMDMWKPYRDAAHTYFRNAKVCADSFHVIALVGRAFDKVRISVMNSFERGSDEYYLLKKYNWLLTSSYEDMDMNRDVPLQKHPLPLQRVYLKAPAPESASGD